MAGYDRRLDALFLQVHDESPVSNTDEDDDDAVYFFAPPGWRFVQSIAESLESLGIAVPASFVPGVEEDQRMFAGNRIVRHRFDGEPTVVVPG